MGLTVSPSGGVQTIGITTAAGVSGTSDGDPVNPKLTVVLSAITPSSVVTAGLYSTTTTDNQANGGAVVSRPLTNGSTASFNIRKFDESADFGVLISDGTTTSLTNGTATVFSFPVAGANPLLTFASTAGISALLYTGAGTGLTGTAASFTAGHVTTNANLTGDVTSVGNAATLANIPALSGANLTSLNATNISSGTLADARNTVSNTTTTSLANLATVGTLTGGATGAGFTVALTTSTLTGNLPDARNTVSNSTTTSLTAVTTLGAAGVVTNMPGTTSASSAITGTLKIGNGTAATNVGIGGGNINAGGTLIVNGDITSTTGGLSIGTSITAGSDIRAGAGNTIYFNGRSRFYTGADGRLNLTTSSGSGLLTRLSFGSETSGNPAFQMSGTTITIGTGDGGTGAGSLVVSGNTTIGSGGTAMSSSKVTTVAATTTAIAAGVVREDTLTVTDATTTSPLAVTFSAAQDDNLEVTLIRSDSGHVYVKWYNHALAANASPAGNITIRTFVP